MTYDDNTLRFSIENGRLYNESDKHDFREVTHIRRLDGGGIDYMKLWISGTEVSAGHIVGEPNFTLPLSPDGSLEGKGPGGYEYTWVLAEE